MQQHMTNLSADYQAVIGEMMNFQRNMVAQDQLMQNIIQYLVNLEAGESPLYTTLVTDPNVDVSRSHRSEIFEISRSDCSFRSLVSSSKTHLLLYRSRSSILRSNGRLVSTRFPLRRCFPSHASSRSSSRFQPLQLRTSSRRRSTK